jgi:putative transposase
MKGSRPPSPSYYTPHGNAAGCTSCATLAHAGRQGRRVVSAFIGTAFVQDDAEAARAQWRQVADQLRPKVPKLAALMDEAEADVLAFMTFPRITGRKSTPSIHSSASTARSSGAPTSSASSPTKMPLRA